MTVVIDAEALIVGKHNNTLCSEIIEIGAVKLNEKNEIIDEFHYYIRPKNSKITMRDLKFLKIDKSNFDNALDFPIAYSQMIKWIDKHEIYSWGSNDLMFLKTSCKLNKIKCSLKINDLQKIYKNNIMNEKLYSVEDAVTLIGEVFDGHQHSALCDAKNTAKIFKFLKKKGCIKR